VGHGCVHSRIDWDFLTTDGVRNYRAFMEDAGDLIARYDGSLSGEHGDGHARAELYPKMFGPELVEAFRQFKAIWDPDWKMNPGKVVDPYPLDTHLRMDPSYSTRPVKTAFRFPGDAGSFAAAAERCFGVGACRDQNAVMCPSYQVTLEEKHSTRGRARLLFEMMRKDSELAGGWRNEEVKEALDLCLACKGCLHECPVRVDMATYKALLRGPPATQTGIRTGADPVGVPARRTRAGAGERVHAAATVCGARQARGRDRSRARHAPVRAGHLQALVPRSRGRERLAAGAGTALARHFQRSLSPGGRRGGHRSPGGGGV
jgi:ferredoxin